MVSPRLVFISSIFITCLITSNIIAVKIIKLGPLSLPAAIIIFPVSYIFGDVLTEVYGYSWARRIIWLGFFSNLIAVLAIWIAGLLPPHPEWKFQEEYEKILGFTPRLLFASFLGYLLGEFSNSFTLAKMKILTKGRFLFSRTIGSTIIGQALDTFTFLLVAFTGVIPLGLILRTALYHWLFKVLYETLATPLTYMVVNSLKKKEGVDAYDYKTDFNPLRF